ncbi:MAG: molybdopterin molybdotransferase MoeA [Candidatus Nezhaarchaeales archaeon]
MDPRKFRYIRLEEALKKIDECIRVTLPAEEVRICEAYNRFLAEDVVSKIDLPPHDVAHFDGYALRSRDVACASPVNPVKLKIKAKIFPSSAEALSIGAGEAAYVATGAIMPLGADSVLPIEAALVKEGHVEVKYAVKPGDHIIRAGSDVKQGDLILKRGHRLRGQDIAFLALVGYSQVKVSSMPKVCIMPIGDELTEDYGTLKPGKVPCSHTLMISSFVLRDGGIPVYQGIVPDDANAISEAIAKASARFDVILTISGASRGEKDLVCEAMSRIEGANIVFHGVMTRPGRQTGFALIRGKPLIMLPGLSHSTIVGYQLIARRAISRLMGIEVDDLPLKARIACNLELPPPKGFKRIVFVRLENYGDYYRAWPLKGESALASIPVKGHGYVIFNEGLERVNEGSIVDVHLLY